MGPRLNYLIVFLTIFLRLTLGYGQSGGAVNLSGSQNITGAKNFTGGFQIGGTSLGSSAFYPYSAFDLVGSASTVQSLLESASNSLQLQLNGKLASSGTITIGQVNNLPALLATGTNAFNLTTQLSGSLGSAAFHPTSFFDLSGTAGAVLTLLNTNVANLQSQIDGKLDSGGFVSTASGALTVYRQGGNYTQLEADGDASQFSNGAYIFCVNLLDDDGNGAYNLFTLDYGGNASFYGSLNVGSSLTSDGGFFHTDGYGNATMFTLSSDNGSFSSDGRGNVTVDTVTDGGGNSFSNLNASNITAGTLSNSLGGSGTVSGIMKADGAGNVSQSIAPLVDGFGPSGSTVVIADGDSLTDTIAGTSCTNQCGIVSGTNTIAWWGSPNFNAARVYAGALVTGSGIPSGTYVRSLENVNSVTLTQNATVSGTFSLVFTGTSWPAELQTLSSCANGKAVVYNFAVAGTNIANLVARYATTVHPLRPSVTGAKRAIYIPYVGTNDIYANDPYTVLAAMESLWSTAKADGFEVWACTLPYKNDQLMSSNYAYVYNSAPWSDNYNGGGFTRENATNVLNDLIRRDAVPNHIIDMSSQFVDSQRDMIHPTVLGCKQQARYINLALLAGGDLPISSPNNIVVNTITSQQGRGATVITHSFADTDYQNAFGMPLPYAFGVYGICDISGYSFNLANPAGIFSNLRMSGTGSMGNAITYGARIQSTAAFGISSTVQPDHREVYEQSGVSSGTTTNQYGIYLDGPAIFDNGHIVNQTALYIPDQTANQSGHVATGSNYAILQTGTTDNVSLAGPVSMSNTVSVTGTLNAARVAFSGTSTAIIISGTNFYPHVTSGVLSFTTTP